MCLGVGDGLFFHSVLRPSIIMSLAGEAPG
jgi:hypothetical protein